MGGPKWPGQQFINKFHRSYSDLISVTDNPTTWQVDKDNIDWLPPRTVLD